MAVLFIVATLIGNLKDISLRALECLQEADLVACEDTRRSLKLLTHYGIRKPLLSCHGHNEEKASIRIAGLLEEGKKVAYLSDAGTPALSDPGSRLVRAIQDRGYPVVPLPGPSAFATLLSVAGFPDKTVTFEGFLSPKSGRRRSRLRELLQRGEAFLLYESVHRILKLLDDIAEEESGRPIVVGREMTKEFEEYLRGTAGEVKQRLQERDAVKGEFSVLVSGGKKS